MCIIGKTHEAPRQVFLLLVDSLSYFTVAGFLLETGTVPLFRYMNFHILTCFFNQFPSILPSDSSLLSLEHESVTATRSIYQEILLMGQHYLRTFIDLNSHLFEQIIRVCRYMYDGFSSGQWKIEKDGVML